jgi:hypothetical protein
MEAALLDARSLKHQHVDRRRVANELFHERGFASVRAKITRVEESAPASVYVKRVCIEGRMVDEVRGEAEGADREWLPVCEEPSGLNLETSAGKEERLLEDASGGLSYEDRNRRRKLANESVVVRVAMRDDDAAQRVV